MVFFAHGTAFDNLTFVNPGHEDDYAIALGLGKESNNKLNIFGSNISAISSDAFAENNVTLFYTCRTGAEFKGTIFAQKWANLTLGNVQAAVEKTDYHNIYPDERNFVEKLLLVKAEREEARAEFGFSKDGCKNYPEILHNGKWITFSKKPENKRQVLRFKDILSKEK